MAEYADYCDTVSSEKGYAIKTATQKISELSAEIEDSEAQIQEYADEVAAVGTALAGKEKQLSEAEAVLVTSIDELERAIHTIKKDGEEAASLVQLRGSPAHRADFKSAVEALRRIVDATWVNAVSKRQIQGLLQAGDGDDLKLTGGEAPEVAAFESATGGITQTLEEMLGKAEESLADTRTTEMREQHSFEMMAQSLTDAVKVAKEKIANAKSVSSQEEESLGESKNELEETKKNLKSDEAYLKSLTLDCGEAKAEWAERQKDAADEMT